MKQNNIRNISKLLSYNCHLSEFDKKYYRMYKKFLSDNSNFTGKFSKYMPDRLHDSEVINISKVNGNYFLKLNDINTVIFAQAIHKKLNINYDFKKFVFPLTIEFSKISNVNFYKINSDNGELTRIRNVKLSEYLYEHIIKIENGEIDISILFWKSNNVNGEYILLRITAEKIKILEEQKLYWKKLFGNKFNKYYLKFVKDFEKGRYLSDLTECYKLIDVETDIKNKSSKKPQ